MFLLEETTWPFVLGYLGSLRPTGGPFLLLVKTTLPEASAFLLGYQETFLLCLSTPPPIQPSLS